MNEDSGGFNWRVRARLSKASNEPVVFNYLYRWTWDPPTKAQDLIHDAFEKLWAIAETKSRLNHSMHWPGRPVINLWPDNRLAP